MPDLDRVVRRNTFLLAATLAVNSAVLQLVAAVSSLTFVLVTGVAGLLGLGPAIFLSAAACTGAVAGRMMDRVGRRPVLVSGFVVGGTGCALTAYGTHATSTPAVIVGFVLTGVSSATSLLVRTAAGDMYPPERRARGISYVLVGAVFGAILGPTFFSPLFAGKSGEADALTVAWLAASGISLVSASIVALVRPDTKKIAELIAPADAEADRGPQASLAEILRRPGVIPAMLAAFASFGVMVSVMNLTGYVVVEKHGHAQHDVFPIVGAHVLGMYALVLIVGQLVDRVGRPPALSSSWAPPRSRSAGPRASLRLRSSSSGWGSAGTSPTWPRPPSSPTSRFHPSGGGCSASTTSRLRSSERPSRCSAA
jgi:MFS family permease